MSPSPSRVKLLTTLLSAHTFHAPQHLHSMHAYPNICIPRSMYHFVVLNTTAQVIKKKMELNTVTLSYTQAAMLTSESPLMMTRWRSPRPRNSLNILGKEAVCNTHILLPSPTLPPWPKNIFSGLLLPDFCTDRQANRKLCTHKPKPKPYIFD